MRPVVALAIRSAVMLAPIADAKPAAHVHACALQDKTKVALTGIARSIQSGAEEPTESINTYFFLETRVRPCGEQRISVFAPGIIPCGEGDKVTVRGIYYAPDATFTWPMIDGARVSCGGR